MPLTPRGTRPRRPPPSRRPRSSGSTTEPSPGPKPSATPPTPHHLRHDSGRFTLTQQPGGLNPAQRAKYPHLATGYDAFRIDAREEEERTALTG
ncbi:hypothetical protein GCM10020000_58250 [Streptomyces olivoverticillatus]